MHNHNNNDKNFDELFWADQIAKQITSRENFITPTIKSLNLTLTQ